MPALKTILDRRKAQNGDYMEGSYYDSNYYRTWQISFFPKKNMKLDEAFDQLDIYGGQVERSKRMGENNFYYDRPILLNDPSQSNLERWL